VTHELERRWPLEGDDIRPVCGPVSSVRPQRSRLVEWNEVGMTTVVGCGRYDHRCDLYAQPLSLSWLLQVSPSVQHGTCAGCSHVSA